MASWASALAKHRAPHTQAGGSTPSRGRPNTSPASPSPSKPRKPPAPGRVQRLLANAGTRASLPDESLPPHLLAQRQLNQRLAQPVTPGSSMTERDLARQTRAAGDVRYGAAEQQAQQNVAAAGQMTRNTSDWYDAYLRELAAHQANVGRYQQQAQTAVQGLSQATGALPAAGAAQGLSAENQQVAGNASAVRRALTDSFGAQLASQGANANTHASALTNVVGPGAKVQALQRAAGTEGKTRQQLEQLVKERGQFRQQLGEETRQSEAKNVLAQAIATGKSAVDTAQLKETVRSHRATESNTAASRKAREADRAGTPNKYGYTNAEWRGMTTEQRQQKIKEFAAKGKGKTAKPGRGPGSLTAAAEGRIVEQINRIAGIIKADPKDKDGNSLTRNDLITGDSPLGSPLDPRIVNIAYDLARNGGLSPANVKAAQQLNIHVGGTFPIAKKKPKAKPLPPGPGAAVGAVVGQGGIP